MAGVDHWLVTNGIRLILRTVCRVDDAALANVPSKGPLIIVANHVNIIDAPMLYTHMQPRPVIGFAKIETWENPFTRVLFNLWEAIPVLRGEVDRDAFNQAEKILHDSKILCVAPEGTRSGNGRLQQGYPGVVLMAQRSCASLLPVAYYGHEDIWSNIRHLKRTDFHIVVGNPFRIDIKSQDLTRELRQKVANEIMFQIAALLPQQYRGKYSQINQASEDHLRFAPGVTSNLSFA